MSSKLGSSLPPGFRFHPTDEELIRHYLKRKSTSASYPMSIIAEVDIYKFDPWDLPAKAMFGEKEWYFFSPRDRKYPKGARPNRTAASGYWKATGTDKPILDSKEGDKYIGVKKALVFYVGRPPKGIKTNWIMHEYRLSEGPNMKPKPNDLSMRLDDWVLCRIYMKYHATQTAPSDEQEQEEPLVQAEFSHQLPILSHHSNQHTLIKSQKSCSFSDLLDAIDNSTLTRFLLDNPYESIGAEPGSILNYGADPNQSNNNNSIKSSSYLINQKLPHYYHHIGSSSSVLDMDNNNNQLKRQHSSMVVTNIDEDMFMLHPTKKSMMMSSCSGGTNKNLDTLNQCQLHNQYY